MRSMNDLVPVHNCVALMLVVDAKRAGFDIQATSDLGTWQNKGLTCTQGPHQIDQKVIICSACLTLWIDPKLTEQYEQTSLPKFIDAIILASEHMVNHLKRDRQRPIDAIRGYGTKKK